MVSTSYLSEQEIQAARKIIKWWKCRWRKHSLVYELRFEGRQERYIGSTCQGAKARLYCHLRDSKNETGYTLHEFMRKVGQHSVSLHVIAYVARGEDPTTLEKAKIAEVGMSHPLLNIVWNSQVRVNM